MTNTADQATPTISRQVPDLGAWDHPSLGRARDARIDAAGPDRYRVTLDGLVMGHVRRSRDGWTGSGESGRPAAAAPGASTGFAAAVRALVDANTNRRAAA